MRLLKVLLALTLVLASSRLMAQQAAPKQPAPAKPEKIVAVVNGEAISDTELTSSLQRQLRGRELPPEQAKEIRKMMLNAIIDARLVEQFLAAKKIEADPKEIDGFLQQLKQRVAGAGMSFDELLKRQGNTEQALRRRIAGEFAFQKYAESVVTDQAVETYFNAHKEELDGTEVRASHILVKYPENPTDADKQAALKKIKSIQQELAKGLDFAEAAKKYSDCPSKSQGGDLDFFPRHNRMVEPFAAAAFAMKPGAVSEPVETDFGWHLIKVTDRKPGDKGLDAARDEIKDQLSRDLWDKTAAEQRKVAKIEIRE